MYIKYTGGNLNKLIQLLKSINVNRYNQVKYPENAILYKHLKMMIWNLDGGSGKTKVESITS